MKAKKERSVRLLFLLLFFCSVGLLVVGYLNRPVVKSLALTENLHLGVWSRDLDSRLVFFNEDEYNPSNLPSHFRGSRIQKTATFSMIPGIYYRYIRTDADTQWVCQISLWYPIIISGLLSVHYFLKETFSKNFPGKTDANNSPEDS